MSVASAGMRARRRREEHYTNYQLSPSGLGTVIIDGQPTPRVTLQTTRDGWRERESE